MQQASSSTRPRPHRPDDSAGALDLLFAHIYEAVGEPMLMLSSEGHVLGASDEQAPGAAGPHAEADSPLRERWPHYRAALCSEAPWSSPQQADITRTLPNGSYMHERLSLQPTAWGACLRVADRSAERTLETADLQTSRLAALGFMVAGVCHEVTNPLTSLHSIVQILRSEQPLAPALLRKGLDNIAVNVNRILEISRRLVKFSRVGDEPRMRLAIDGVIDEALLELCQQGVLREVDVQRLVSPDATVDGNPGQLRQIFLNLFANAAQAMLGQGRLTIESRRSGPLTEVLVTDSGPGVPQAVASRIFEPFFTTHSETNGSGLGLPVSAEIAHDHGGTLQLRPGGATGATFCLSLPASAP